MAILYKVSVQSIDLENKTIALELDAVHPDAMYFSDNIGFALRLLHDSAPIDSALAKIVDQGTLRNEEWLKNNAKGIIAQCELMEVRAPEVVPTKNNGKYAYWQGETKQSSASLKITATDKTWIAHLTNQSAWGSTAYDTEVDYQAREPIASTSEEFSSDLINSGGWIAIESNTIDGYSAEWPKHIYVPRYSQKSYRRADKISHKDLTRDLMSAMLFKTVFTLDRNGTKSFGILIPAEARYGVLLLTSTGKRGNYFDLDHILAIGIAEFNTNDSLKAEVYSPPQST